jgi:hypothetical protein
MVWAHRHVRTIVISDAGDMAKRIEAVRITSIQVEISTYVQSGVWKNSSVYCQSWKALDHRGSLRSLLVLRASKFGEY